MGEPRADGARLPATLAERGAPGARTECIEWKPCLFGESSLSARRCLSALLTANTCARRGRGRLVRIERTANDDRS